MTTPVPLKRVVEEIDLRAGSARPPLLSVSIHRGVVPRSEITDDLPRADDLSNYKVCQQGDLVLNRMRAFQGAIGVSPVAGLVSPDYLVLRPRSGVSARYLHHAFRSSWFVGEMTSRIRGIGSVELGTVRTPRINAEDLLAIEVPLPTADDQRQIADFLDDQVARIDNIIAARRQQLAGLVAERQSAVFDLITGQSYLPRRPSGLSWAGTLPTEWDSTRLTHVARMGTGHTPSRSVAEYWVDCSIPWLATGDVHRFRRDEIDEIDDTELHISKIGLANSAAVLHTAGTVALSRTASAGFSIVMGRAMATSQDYATWTCGPKINELYLLWCLRSMRKDVMGRLATGSTHKTIYFPDLMSIRVPLPPLVDQQLAVAAIGEAVDAERRRSIAITRSIQLFQELKRSLITAAVTGDFDVSSADGSRVPA